MGSDGARRLAAGVLAAALLAGGAARAQSAADRETARGLMDEGMERRQKGDHKGALERFEAADALMHVPTTGVEVARERVALGKLIEAREALAGVVRHPARAGEPTPFAVARAAAQRLDDELAARVPSLKITVSGADGAPTVTVDGAEVPPAALVAPRRLNPGQHVVVARSGAREGRAQVSLKERDAREVTIELPPAAPTAGDDAREHDARIGDAHDHDARDKDARDKDADQKPDGADGGNAARVVEYVGFGVAGIGVVVGAVAGLSSLSSAAAARKGCDANNLCPPSTHADLDAARSAGNVSTAAFIVAGAGAVAGIVGLIVANGASKKPTRGASVAPWIGLGSAGVSGRF